jgi:hypothetical protein
VIEQSEVLSVLFLEAAVQGEAEVVGGRTTFRTKGAILKPEYTTNTRYIQARSAQRSDLAP